MMKDGLSQILKQAQALQTQMQQAQEELQTLEVVGEAGAGLVKVVMNGRHEVKTVQLDPGLLQEEMSIIEALVAAAVNNAVQKVAQQTQAKFGALTQGLSMPGGFKLPFSF